MEHLRFKTYEDLNRFLTKLTCIGKGTQGTVYLFDNKWSLKIVNYQLTKRCLAFKDVNIDGFSFATNFIYVGNKPVGVICPYIKGVDLKKYHLYLENIQNVIMASRKLLFDIKKLSNSNIRAVDVWEENIIYNDGNLGVIDTLEFFLNRYKDLLTWDAKEIMFTFKAFKLAGYIDKSLMPKLSITTSSKGLFAWNIEGIMPIVMASSLDDYTSKSLIRKFLTATDSRYQDYKSDIDLLQNPEELLLGIKRELEEFLQMRIARFSDVEEPLKRKLSK